MRVLMITATYLPSTNGVAIAVSNLKKSLEKLGHEVKVLAPFNLDAAEEMGVIRYPSIPNPMIKDYPIPLFPGIKSIYSLITSFKPDVVHVHHPFHIGFFAKIIADQFKVPLVFTFHTRYDLYAEKYAMFLPNKLKKELIGNNVYNFCKEVDLVVAPSNFVYSEITKKYPYLNVKVIPSAVGDFDKNKISKLDLREKYDLPKDKKILLSVSRLGKEKNIDVLIKSVKELPKDFHLLIVGSGPDKQRLVKLASTKELKGRIKFQGRVDHNQISDFYRLSDMFYYSSLTETQGLIFLEAITFGLPIVAVKSPASVEWVKEDFGILSDNTPISIAQNAVKLSLLNSKKLSEAAKKYSLKFSPIKISKQLSDSYEEVIERKKLAYKLLNTGWQSWSPNKKRLIKYPEWNYKPNKDFYLPNLDANYPHKKPVRGWCSWYSFGKDISESKILSQAKWFKKHREIPIEYILIDEGWTLKGDWDLYKKDKFSGGISGIVNKIKNYGFKTGIWMAPFLVDPKSVFFNKHKELLVEKNGNHLTGLRIVPIYDLYDPVYVLDVRKKEARNLIYRNIDLILGKYGIDLIKLDFLYSVFFIPGITEKEAGYYIRNIFQYIRKNYPNVYTIACGAPLSPLIGIVDSIRIGPDIISPTTSEWKIIGKLMNSYKLNLVLNSINTRLWTNKYWNLDPDVFVCREALKFSNKNISDLQKAIKTAGGNIFLGDDFNKLDTKLINKFIKPLFEVDN